MFILSTAPSLHTTAATRIRPRFTCHYSGEMVVIAQTRRDIALFPYLAALLSDGRVVHRRDEDDRPRVCFGNQLSLYFVTSLFLQNPNTFA